MKTTPVSHPFPCGYVQIPLLPSSSNSAFRKESGVAAVSVGFEQDCVTLLTPRPPCACPNLGHICLSWLFSRGPEKLCRGCTVTQGWALSLSVKIQTLTTGYLCAPKTHDPSKLPKPGSSINVSQKTCILLLPNLLPAKSSTDAICIPLSQILEVISYHFKPHLSYLK